MENISYFKGQWSDMIEWERLPPLRTKQATIGLALGVKGA
jgi:hypothetical protein